jgi:general secretion pathway protein K
MLALMAAATQALTVTSYQSERHAMVDARAEADLNAAIVRAVLGISDLRAERRWRVDATAQTIVHDGLRIGISVQDETGRIDLNAASGSLIRQLLLGSGLSPDGAGAMSDRILDWRSTSGLNSLNGASDADYRAAGIGYSPRRGPFQTVDELRLVLGMTPALFARIRPALTVYSARPMFDASVAPREALLALYPSDPGKIDEIMRARLGNPDATALQGAAANSATQPAPIGRAYTVTARLAIGRRVFGRVAVVELTGDGERPYFVMAWQ